MKKIIFSIILMLCFGFNANAEKGINVARPTFTKVNSLLKDLVRSGFGQLSSIRI